MRGKRSECLRLPLILLLVFAHHEGNRVVHCSAKPKSRLHPASTVLGLWCHFEVGCATTSLR